MSFTVNQWLSNITQAQNEGYRHHDACLRCQKCANNDYCHEYIPNCGAFTPHDYSKFDKFKDRR